MISLLGLISGTGMAPLESKAEKGGVSSAGSNSRLSKLNPSRKNENLSLEMKRNFLEIVSTYTKYQEMMDRKSDLVEIAETLGGIIEAARELALHESDDWFDKHTIKRNMSELDKLSKEFDKFAVEANGLDQRLHGLYEDMGHILSRYYKFGDISEKQMKSRLGLRENKKGCGCNSVNEIQLKKGDKIRFKNGESIYIRGPKGDGYDYSVGKQKGWHPKQWFDMMISSKKATVESVTENTKKELNKVTSKLRSKLENIEEISYDSQGSLKVGKKYKNLGDYEKVAKKGDYIWVGNDENVFKKVYKSHLLKVLGKDSEGNIIVTPFGRNKKSTIPQKNMGVIVAEVLNEDSPCWDGYEMVGMKMKDGKEVPNCVPKK